MRKKKGPLKAPSARKGSLASFEQHFRAAMASAIRTGVEHPFAIALLSADAATKAETRKASKASARQRPQTQPSDSKG